MLVPPPPRRSSPWKTTRRTLLIGGGAGVGLAIGWLAWPRSETATLSAGPGNHIVNAWLKIGSDGRVIVICPQAEMGQGIHSALAQVLSDELGADWRTVSVEAAPLNPVYVNRAVLGDAFEAMPGPVRAVGAWAAGHVLERLDAQITGGSTSVRAFDGPMRLAGAAARTMLVKAAARGWGVDPAGCDTKDGFVINGANRVRFADVAAKAVAETPDAEPKLRPVTAVGRAARRLDVPAKVDGSAKFAADVRLPGMVFASVRHGPVGTRARGVLAGAVRPGVVMGPGWVAATGETWWAANRAVGTLAVTWPVPREAADSAVVARRLAAALDAMPVLVGAGRLVEARYSVPFVPHAAIETMTATARIGSGGVEVWAPTQSTRLTTYAVARALGVGEGAVTVYPTLIGGGFGRKIESDCAVQAALIARAVGRPVQLIWSREEDMANSFPRPAAGARMMARLGTGGAIASWAVRVAAPPVSGPFALRNMGTDLGGGPDKGSLQGAERVPYAVGEYSAELVEVASAVPVGWWRSVAHSHNAFFVESFVDELAKAAGKDPAAYRLELLKGAPRHAAVLRAALGAADYGQGMGVALHEGFGSIVAQVVELADGELRASHVTVAIDCGRAVNPDGVRQQMEGGVIWGLSAAMSGRQTFAGGWAGALNFDGQPLMGLGAAPGIETVILTNPAYPLGGVGEAGVPCAAPALANAIAASTGKRLRDLPLALG
jgi:isoquinoline 1-oxidoreductase beta subunit